MEKCEYVRVRISLNLVQVFRLLAQGPRSGKTRRKKKGARGTSRCINIEHRDFKDMFRDRRRMIWRGWVLLGGDGNGAVVPEELSQG